MILELKHVYKTYMTGDIEVPVLKDISLSVEEGEYVAIMGPSGSGKTTLMNIIGCLDTLTDGEYILDGEDISKLSENKMSDIRLNKIGFVFQNFSLLQKQTALENVELPLLYAGVSKSERVKKAIAALQMVSLQDRIHFMPNQLSGGQCQRVAIARAMINSPKIILADEPTGSLDSRSGEQVMELFRKLNDNGVTVIMITHDQNIASHAKRIIRLLDGRIVDGPDDRTAFLAEAYNSQNAVSAENVGEYDEE